MTASVLVAVLISSVALAADPVAGGLYNDSAHGIIIGVVGTHEIRAFDMTCRGKEWVARMIIGVHLATGEYSYSGADRLARHGHVTSKAGTMTVSGVFQTAHLATGHATAGGCSTSYRAVFVP